MFFRQPLQDETACASYLFGCKSTSQFAVVDPHVDLVDSYVELAGREDAEIVAVLETHVQADHVSGLPALVDVLAKRLDFIQADNTKPLVARLFAMASGDSNLPPPP